MSEVEQMIQAKGLNAPRVTPAHVESVIAGEFYFTAEDGVEGALREVGSKDVSIPQALSLLTICVLVLKNGFTVTGTSACASPENFDADVGRKVARNDALAQIWPLEGYLLKQRLAQMPI